MRGKWQGFQFQELEAGSLLTTAKGRQVSQIRLIKTVLGELEGG